MCKKNCTTCFFLQREVNNLATGTASNPPLILNLKNNERESLSVEGLCCARNHWSSNLNGTNQKDLTSNLSNRKCHDYYFYKTSIGRLNQSVISEQEYRRYKLTIVFSSIAAITVVISTLSILAKYLI